MGRNLPWARKTENVVGQSSAPVAVAAGTNKVEADTSVAQDKWRSTPRTPRTPRKRAHARTPSTSPPPPPGPPPFSLMEPGYANDDIYIMVEDEFCSIAQSYTAHLHHAEYKRLMRKAREAPPREVADLSPSKPRDARDRAKREQLRERQRSALDDMLGQHGIANDDDDDSEEGEDGDVTTHEQEDRKAAGRWRNNGLAGLMRDGSQAKTSLVGLERLPSSTRAAMGYHKSSESDARIAKRHEFGKDDIDDIFRVARKGGRQHQGNNNIDIPADRHAMVTQDENSSRHHPSYRKPRSQTVRMREDHTEKNLQKGYLISTTTKSKRSFVDDLEDELDRETGVQHSSPSTLMSKSQGKVLSDSKTKSEQDKKKKDRKSRIDEVPMFMF